MQEQLNNLKAMGNKLQGSALASFIIEITQNKKVFNFSQFTQLPAMKDLQKSHPDCFHLLDLFCYHDFSYYKSHTRTLPQLNPSQLRKLKQLSIISFCENSRQLNIRQLLKDLQVDELTLIEMVMELSQFNLVKMKMNEKTNTMRIQYCVSRDIRPEEAKRIEQRLNTIINQNQKILDHLSKQITVASSKK